MLRRVGLVAFAVAAVAAFLLAPDTGRFDRVALLVLIGVLAVVWHLVLAPTQGTRVDGPEVPDVPVSAAVVPPASAAAAPVGAPTDSGAPVPEAVRSTERAAMTEVSEADGAVHAEVIDLREPDPLQGGSGRPSVRPSGYFDLGGDEPPTNSRARSAPAVPLPPAPSVAQAPVVAAAAPSGLPIPLPVISTTAVVVVDEPAQPEPTPPEPVSVGDTPAEPADDVVAVAGGARIGGGGDDPWLMWASTMFEEPVGGG